MIQYDDPVTRLDDHGVTIKSYGRPRHPRTIPYREIRAVEVIELGPLSGRHRLVGFGFRRPRHFFHWDSARSTKTSGIALDAGRLIRPVITPEDPEGALAVLERHLANRT